VGIDVAPIDAARLVTYLELLGEHSAPNTVRLALSALCELDKAARFTPADPNPSSLRKHPVVARWYKSWSRDVGSRARKQAAALETTQLEALLRAAAEPPKGGARNTHVLTYARDRCLILFGVCGAFRGNDLAQIEASDVEATERGLRVLLRRSKSDQAGEGAHVGLMAQGRVQLCPVDAWQQWMRVRGGATGALFVATTRAGELDFSAPLSERSIRRLITGYAKRAGIASQISSHSLRATFATLATAQGKRLEKIMRHGRWESAETALRYMRQAELFDDNASGGLLD
jgi:integrase